MKGWLRRYGPDLFAGAACLLMLYVAGSLLYHAAHRKGVTHEQTRLAAPARPD